MKIASWNVNSIRQRYQHVADWVHAHECDILLLQEIKVQTENFPFEYFQDLGFNVAVHGQKTFNGVAILSKFPIEDVILGLPTFEGDPQARYIEAFTGGVRVASVYVPNGQSVGSEKYAYKLDFFERLRQHLAQQITLDEKFVVGGDYNVAPADIDVHDPKVWEGEILCSLQERLAFKSLLNEGLGDAYRLKYPNQRAFSWWDYRSGGFARNDGLRIDHLLLSHRAMDALEDVGIDNFPRSLEKPSDHAPVFCILS
jgi:exodeoxyribonuclease-3